METILTVVDLKSGAREVMSETRRYARAFGAKVILVNIEPLLPGAEGTGKAEVERDLADGYAEEIRTVHDLGEELAAEGIDHRVLIIEGTAADQLVLEAEREEPDLIIIANRQHGALVEALTHGLREQLAKRLRYPLLLVPAG